MKKTDLLKMRVGDSCIYLGRQGKKVYVWGEKGEEVDVTKLPVYNRKFIKTKLESIPVIKGEVDASKAFEGCEGGITGEGDVTEVTETQAETTTETQTDGQDSTTTDENSTEGEGEGDASGEGELNTQEDGDDSETSDNDEDSSVEEDSVEETVESLADKHKLDELKTMAEELRVEAQEKLGKPVEVELKSLRKKTDVAEKIFKLRELIAQNS